MENEIEKAKALIEQEKTSRAEEFNKELQALCDKYQCSLSSSINIIPS